MTADVFIFHIFYNIFGSLEIMCCLSLQIRCCPTCHIATVLTHVMPAFPRKVNRMIQGLH